MMLGDHVTLGIKIGPPGAKLLWYLLSSFLPWSFALARTNFTGIPCTQKEEKIHSEVALKVRIFKVG